MGRNTADALDSLDSDLGKGLSPNQPDGIGRLRNVRLDPFHGGLFPQGGWDPDRVTGPVKVTRPQYYRGFNSQGQPTDAMGLSDMPLATGTAEEFFGDNDFQAGALPHTHHRRHFRHRFGGRPYPYFVPVSGPDTIETVVYVNDDDDSDASGIKGASLYNRNDALKPGDAIVSPNGRFALYFQPTDRNLVIYEIVGGNLSKIVRPLRAWGSGITSVILQSDGNFVTYRGRSPGWASDVRGKRLTMQNDGNLVLDFDGRPVWSSETNGPKVYEPSRGLFSAVTHAVGSAASSVASAASSVAAPVAHLVTSPIKAAAAIARGDNVLSTLGNHFKDQVKNVKDVAPVAQTVISFVPGVGAGVNAAIAAGSAIAQGKSITDAVVGAAKAAIPGGPLAQQAFDAAYQMGKAAATGGNIGEAALSVARDQAASKLGPVAGKAFDVGLALAHGQNIQQVVKNNALDIVKTAAPSALSALPGVNMPSLDNPLSPMASRALSGVGPVIGSISKAGESLLSPQVARVAQALVSNPALRSMPIDRLASRMGVPVDAARQGVASVVTAVSNVPRAGGAIPRLAPNLGMAEKLSHGMSLDHAMAAFASNAARDAFSPNVRKARPMREIRWHRRRDGKLAQVVLTNARGFGDAGAVTPPFIQQGSTDATTVRQWQKILVSAGLLPNTPSSVDGSFGPNTKAATMAFQAAHGLTPDGQVGPLTWGVALGQGGTPATTPAVPVVTTSTAAPVVTTYLVTAGDTMSSIARNFTGNANRWTELAKANPKVSNPDKIQVGMVLNIPSSWGTKPTAAPVAAPTTTPVLGAPAGTIASQVATAAQQAVSSILGGTPIQQTIAENPAGPIASPISILPSLSTAPVAMQGPQAPITTVTQTPDGPVTATTLGETVTVSQPPISGSKPSSALLIGGLALGAILLVGGSGKG